MSANWFYAKDGQAHGPLTQAQLQDLLSKGTIQGTSQIFRDGDSQWRRVAEVPELQALLKTGEKAAATTPVAAPGQWILLVKSKEDTQIGKPRFHQQGPFHKDKILEMIQKGEAQWTDHVWTEGFQSWMRISALKEFNEGLDFPLASPAKTSTTPAPSSVSTAQDPVAPPKVSADQQEDTQPGVEASSLREQPGATKPPPSDSAAPSLGNPVDSNSSASGKKAGGKSKIKLAEFLEASQIAITKSRVRLSQLSLGQRRGLLYGGSALVVLTVLGVSVFRSPTPSPERTVASEANTPQASAPAASPAPVQVQRPAPPPPPPPVEPAKYVHIVPMKMDSKSPQLAFETNLPVGGELQVTVRSVPGQILDLARFERTTKVIRQAEMVPTLDLSAWKLPEGSYVVTVESEAAKETKSIFVGQKNRQFQSRLDQHNRKIQLQGRAEKTELKAFAKRMQQLVLSLEKGYAKNRKNPQAWAKFYRNWSRDFEQGRKGLVGKYRSANSSRYVNFRSIAEAKDIGDDIEDVASSLNNAIKSKRAPANVKEVGAIKTRLKKVLDAP